MSETVARKGRELTESFAVITGGTSGVGLATAMQLAGAGVPGIALVGRNVERGEAAAASVRDRFPSCETLFVSGDINEPAGARAACEAARARFGRVDILVNSTVGPYPPTLFHNIPIEDIAKIIHAQMMGPLLTCSVVVPWMRESGGGVIVNIASDAGKLTTPGESVIGAAMAGITMFSRTLAMEGKRDFIRVNVLTPSIIGGTPTHGRMMVDPFASKLFGKAIKMAQLGLVMPDDLAAMIVFLASPAAARLSGQAISINGGISAA